MFFSPYNKVLFCGTEWLFANIYVHLYLHCILKVFKI